MSFENKPHNKRKAKLPKPVKVVEEVNELVIEEKQLVLGQITKDGGKIIHIYEDGKVLVSVKIALKLWINQISKYKL